MGERLTLTKEQLDAIRTQYKIANEIIDEIPIPLWTFNNKYQIAKSHQNFPALLAAYEAVAARADEAEAAAGKTAP